MKTTTNQPTPIPSEEGSMAERARRIVPLQGGVRGGFVLSCLILIFGLPFTGRAATNDLSNALQTGLFEEEANRNLPAAIEAYEKVAKQFDQNRALAATAIFRLGEVNRKLGKTNEAAAFYQRIVREFSDQETLAKLSQQNLAGMMPGISAPSAASFQERLSKILTAASESSGTNTAFAERLRQLVEQTGTANNSGQPITAVLDEEETEIRRIQAMIQNSPDLINAPSAGAPAPLCEAASKGQLRVAKFLLDNGAAVNARFSGLSVALEARPKAGVPIGGVTGTALHAAVYGGHRAMTELLLQRGADVEAKTGDGNTAMHIAVSRDFQAVTETLLAHKADVNARASDGRAPLHRAADSSDPAMIEVLLDNGADINATDNKGMTPLMAAAKNQSNAKFIQALIAAKAKLDVTDNEGRTALSYAAESGDEANVKLLLAAKADLNAGKVNLPLHCAIKSQSAGIVEALLKAGADANRIGKVKWTLRYLNGIQRSDENGFEVTPLALAVTYGQLDVIKALLAAKADPNGKRVDGVPLIFSALNDAMLMKALLDAGAKPNVDDGSKNHLSPLCIAKIPEVIRLLLAAGADPQATNGLLTPLQQAVVDGSLENVEALLAGGAQVDAYPRHHYTPLHLAASSLNERMASLLIEYKADANARTDAGETPLDMAINASKEPGASSSAFEKVAETLRQHGGLADLPKLDRIEVTRPETGYRAVAFMADTNGWNQFTLAEVLAQQWGLLSKQQSGAWTWSHKETSSDQFWAGSSLRFPDLARVKVSSPSGNGSARPALNLNLSGPDGWRNSRLLQMGDVVTVPEADHPVTDKWTGLSAIEFIGLSNSVARTVSLIVSGKTTSLVMAPEIEDEGRRVSLGAGVSYALFKVTAPSFMLRSVLDESKLIRSSSDLTRVKVTRREPGKAKPLVWVVDCSIPARPPDLWLRDGDVIEVPEK